VAVRALAAGKVTITLVKYNYQFADLFLEIGVALRASRFPDNFFFVPLFGLLHVLIILGRSPITPQDFEQPPLEPLKKRGVPRRYNVLCFVINNNGRSTVLDKKSHPRQAMLIHTLFDSEHHSNSRTSAVDKPM
jgi:hypothetical protein